MRVLAGDIGGTKALLAIFELRGSKLHCIEEVRFATHAFVNLSAMIDAFRDRVESTIECACLAIAGPIVGDLFRGPNLDWSLDRRRVAEEIGIARTILINDFQAVGYGLERLAPEEMIELQQGKRRPREPIALLGAGTGLGEAYLTWQDDRYEIHPSEGGHVDFGPRTPEEIGLLEYLRGRLERVSVERIVSGSGLVCVYEYFVETGRAPRDPAIVEEMSGEDPAAVISRHGLAKDDPACEQALDLFVSIYGSEAGNLALKVLATGGVYVAGGIAPQIIEKLKEGTFVRAFREKEPHVELLSRIPVTVVVNPRVGLLGAASVAFATSSPGSR